jgi:hypothetical protein
MIAQVRLKNMSEANKKTILTANHTKRRADFFEPNTQSTLSNNNATPLRSLRLLCESLRLEKNERSE